MVTLDGRTSAGDGMTTQALAELMRDLGANDAVNFDGGGSTTMAIEDCWINDVVSFSSDNGSGITTEPARWARGSTFAETERAYQPKGSQ